MSKNFCLLDEPWLPVRLNDGRVVELGLLDVFARSTEVVALAETAPPDLVAHYRLLLAITHRALTTVLGTWKEKDRAQWFRHGLPQDVIRDYLEAWRERFWLFHPHYPFMQVAALATAEETRDKRKPWTQIALASASGDTPIVFDHACDLSPQAISPAQAIGTLLGFLQFAPGGLVRTLRDSDKAGALVNTAAVIPVGKSLAQTLCLALHPAIKDEVDPDLPAWEREPLSIAALCGDPVLASGPNDRYTRSSRAVLFLQEECGNIRWLRFAAGLALGEDPQAPDPMASFREGVNGPVRLTFNDGRALWRDLAALLPESGPGCKAATVVHSAIALHMELEPFEAVYQPLLVAGLASDQAKLLRWRMEQINLPSALLVEPDRVQYLCLLLKKSDELFVDLKRLATSMLAETLPDPSSKDTRSRARSQIEAGPLATTFFACAGRAMSELLELIGSRKPEAAEDLWRTMLRKAALQAWAQVLIGLGASTLALRADARYWPRLHGLLNKQVPLPIPATIDKESVS